MTTQAITPVASLPARGDTSGAFQPGTAGVRMTVALQRGGSGKYSLIRMYDGGLWGPASPKASLSLDEAGPEGNLGSLTLVVEDKEDWFHVLALPGTSPVDAWLHGNAAPVGTPGTGGGGGGGGGPIPLVLDGPIDTLVLNVKQRAQVAKLLTTRKLRVGLGALDPGMGGGSGGPGGPYCEIGDDGALRAPAIILKAPGGSEFALVVGDDGALSTRGL